jgi:hypothetical protein
MTVLFVSRQVLPQGVQGNLAAKLDQEADRFLPLGRAGTARRPPARRQPRTSGLPPMRPLTNRPKRYKLLGWKKLRGWCASLLRPVAFGGSDRSLSQARRGLASAVPGLSKRRLKLGRADAPVYQTTFFGKPPSSANHLLRHARGPL